MTPTTCIETQVTAKRTSSTAGLPGNTRPVKRRASKACHCCRSRKVRCDVVESGIPCTNCRLDEVDCQVTEGKRRKKSHLDSDFINHSPIESIEEKEDEQETLQTFPTFEDMDGLQGLRLPPTPTSNESANIPNLDYDLSHHRPHLIYQTQGHRLTPEERTRRLSSIAQPAQHSITPLQMAANLHYFPPISSRPEIVLPRYIGAVPRQMLSEDLGYLQKKGAFLIPDNAVRNELLRSYAQFVHPYLPLLDLEDFLSAVNKNETGNTVSLLLYHAVMFAASAYIDMRYLSAQGYTSRKAARKAYFQRVKLLYDFDWEVDRVTVVQAVLLMTYWYESPNDPKDVSYWLGIAISIAGTIGLNCNTESSTLLTTQKKRLWKRIWWCTYLRDRVIAMGMRRPIRIRDEDSDVPMLQLEDFETDPLSPELCRMLGSCSTVRDRSKRETLAKLCIALTDVCRRISDVIAVQYTVLGHKVGVTSETTVRLVPRSNGADASEVIRCDRELEQWYNALPLELRYFKPDSRERTTNHDGEIISVHRALLTAVYLTAASALHRPQMMPAMPNLVILPELKDLSRRRVHDAALDITEMYRDLYAHDLIRYLPNTGVTVLLPAIIIHMLDIKSQDGADKHTSMRNFQFCMQALHKLRELYASADFAFSYLDAAIRKSAIADVYTGTNHGSTSMTKSSTSMVKTTKTETTLTPPPDSHDSNIGYVDLSTLADGAQSNSSALSPPSSDHYGMNSTVDSAIISLKDLDCFINIEEDHDRIFTNFEDIEFDLDGPTEPARDNIPQCEQKPEYIETDTATDFEPLVTYEGGLDLFAPNQVDIDDSLFKDIDMEWLADAEVDADEEHVAKLNAQHETKSHEVMHEQKKKVEQVITPPLSSGTPSANE